MQRGHAGREADHSSDHPSVAAWWSTASHFFNLQLAAVSSQVNLAGVAMVMAPAPRRGAEQERPPLYGADASALSVGPLEESEWRVAGRCHIPTPCFPVLCRNREEQSPQP